MRMELEKSVRDVRATKGDFGSHANAEGRRNRLCGLQKRNDVLWGCNFDTQCILIYRLIYSIVGRCKNFTRKYCASEIQKYFK